MIFVALVVVLARPPTTPTLFPYTTLFRSKAQADSRALASAVSIYSAHMGVVPPTLDPLTAVVTNRLRKTTRPNFSHPPTPHAGLRSQYKYAGSTAAGTFVISAPGDGTTVS